MNGKSSKPPGGVGALASARPSPVGAVPRSALAPQPGVTPRPSVVRPPAPSVATPDREFAFSNAGGWGGVDVGHDLNKSKCE